MMLPKHARLAEMGPNYANNFFAGAYLPWLQNNPERQALAGRLFQALESAAKRRTERQKRHGVDIPHTLAVSLTSSCNRRCSFCRARTLVSGPPKMLSRKILESALCQCEDLGMRRISLIGGEPLLFPGVDEWIADHPDFFFSVFTNGLLLNDDRIDRYGSLANAALIVNVSATDDRGTAGSLEAENLRVLDRLRSRNIFFGCSATVHRDNRGLFTRAATYRRLFDAGAWFGILFDYLADFGEESDPFALTPAERREAVLAAREAAISGDRLIICIPEDESIMGGCAAAGRLMLHLSAHGTISPCPLVPYSCFYFGEMGFLDALKSDYFRELREKSRDWEKRDGSCAYRSANREFQAINARFGVANYEVKKSPRSSRSCRSARP